MRHCKYKKIKNNGIVINLLRSIAKHGKIITTQARAKFVRSLAERTMTKMKKSIELNSLSLKRSVISTLGKDNFDALEKFYPLFKDRNGGYTRIVKLMSRKGDNADMALISIVGVKSE